MKEKTMERLNGLELGDVVRIRENEILSNENNVSCGWNEHMEPLAGTEFIVDKLLWNRWVAECPVATWASFQKIKPVAYLIAMISGENGGHFAISWDMLEIVPDKTAPSGYDLNETWDNYFPNTPDLKPGDMIKFRNFATLQEESDENKIPCDWNEDMTEHFSPHQDAEFEFKLSFLAAVGGKLPIKEAFAVDDWLEIEGYEELPERSFLIDGSMIEKA